MACIKKRWGHVRGTRECFSNFSLRTDETKIPSRLKLSKISKKNMKKIEIDTF